MLAEGLSEDYVQRAYGIPRIKEKRRSVSEFLVSILRRLIGSSSPQVFDVRFDRAGQFGVRGLHNERFPNPEATITVQGDAVQVHWDTPPGDYRATEDEFDAVVIRWVRIHMEWVAAGRPYDDYEEDYEDENEDKEPKP